MHALSLLTWWIHIASMLEWMLAIPAVQAYGQLRGEPGWRWLALAMLPALASGMAVCTWHFYDNTELLKGLGTLQAGFTLLGNLALAAAAFHLLYQQRHAQGASNNPPRLGRSSLSGLP
jgi:hypothetical protein